VSKKLRDDDGRGWGKRRETGQRTNEGGEGEKKGGVNAKGFGVPGSVILREFLGNQGSHCTSEPAGTGRGSKVKGAGTELQGKRPTLGHIARCRRVTARNSSPS